MKAVPEMAETVTLTEDNLEELQNMCDELGFRELRQRISRVSWGDLERLVLEVQGTSRRRCPTNGINAPRQTKRRANDLSPMH